jgi:hypothetical protein
MKIVTVATSPDGYYKWLKTSCNRYYTELVTLGMNEKWLGYNWKLLKMKEYIDTLDDNEIVMFVDAYDVILLDDPRNLEEKFIKSDKKIIVGCEENENKSLGHILFDKCDNKPLNSGTYIGYVKYLRKMLKDIIIKNKDPSLDDQKLMIKYCKQNKNIHVDCEQEYFLVKVMPLLEDVDVDMEKNKSYVLHAPRNTRMEKIIRKLNYSITKEEEDELTLFHYNSLQRKAKYYLILARYFILMLVIIAMIVFLYFYK